MSDTAVDKNKQAGVQISAGDGLEKYRGGGGGETGKTTSGVKTVEDILTWDWQVLQ